MKSTNIVYTVMKEEEEVDGFVGVTTIWSELVILRINKGGDSEILGKVK